MVEETPPIESLNIITAYDKNKLIGSRNSLPWKISEDLRYFKRMTENNVIVMGWNTFESLKFKPLKNRINIVLSQKTIIHEHDNSGKTKLLILNYPQEILRIAKEQKIEVLINNKHINLEFNKIFIIGGSMVYKQFLPYCKRLYVTEIQKEYEGDKYFPWFDKEFYNLNQSEFLTTMNGERLIFKEYVRK